MASKSLETLTDKQLETEWTKTAKEYDKVKAQLKAFSEESQRRAAQARADQLMESLGDEEKRALLQSMKAQGIDSEERVNG